MRVLKQLGIELDALHLDAANWRPSLEATTPGEDVADAGAQLGGSHFAFADGSRSERAVPQIGDPAPPTVARALP